MFYYVNGNRLYTTDVPVCDENFNQITAEEYESRMALAKAYREQGTPIDRSNEW